MLSDNSLYVVLAWMVAAFPSPEVFGITIAYSIQSQSTWSRSPADARGAFFAPGQAGGRGSQQGDDSGARVGDIGIHTGFEELWGW